MTLNDESASAKVGRLRFLKHKKDEDILFLDFTST